MSIITKYFSCLSKFKMRKKTLEPSIYYFPYPHIQMVPKNNDKENNNHYCCNCIKDNAIKEDKEDKKDKKEKEDTNTEKEKDQIVHNEQHNTFFHLFHPQFLIHYYLMKYIHSQIELFKKKIAYPYSIYLSYGGVILIFYILYNKNNNILLFTK
jgi:hypothetical protein